MTKLLIIGAMLAGMLIAGAIQKRSMKLRRWSSGLLISYLTLVLMVGSLEIYLRCCYAESDNAPTLAQRNWSNRYVHNNTQMYRDREWQPQDWEGKITVLLAGDSFTQGWGLENTADRFGDVLAARLGNDYAVFNLGMPGTGPVEQLESLKRHPVQRPDVVILQYFLNDIDYTALKMGLRPVDIHVPSLAQESYLLNFLFWRLGSGTGSVTTPDGTTWPSWWDWAYAAYDNFALWQQHQLELEAFIDYCESIDTRLIVVIFPNLTQVVRSIPYVDRVAHVFEARGVPTLKLFDAAASWQTRDLIVSNRDTHASAAFHHLVGELLYERFFAHTTP